MKSNHIHLASILLIVLMILLSSCVTKVPYEGQEYFQAMGLDGQFMVTANAKLIDIARYFDTSDDATRYIVDRMERISFSMYRGSGDYSPVVTDFTGFDFYGAIEGNYKKTVINGALKLSDRFTSEKDPSTDLRYYRDTRSGLELAVPASGIVLFSTENVAYDYSITYKNRSIFISDEDAEKLSSAQIGLYVVNPRTMFDLGFEVNEKALSNIRSILLIMNDDLISVEFRMLDETLASSFSIIIKGGYIGNLRREGAKVDISALKEMFTQNLDTVYVNDMPLTEEQRKSIDEAVSKLLGILQ